MTSPPPSAPPRFARLGQPGAEIPVLQTGDVTYDLRPITTDIDARFLASDGLRRALDLIDRLPTISDAPGRRVGAPIATPGKVVCIGVNYTDHAKETNAPIPAEPIVFMKDPSTVVGPFDTVLIPRSSRKTDWEVELGVVIGATARYLATDDDADAVIAGYVISHDVSEREFQLERGGQWDKGKSCETFNPLGPYLVPAHAVTDPQDLRLRLWVNGHARQDGSTANMIFPVRHLIRYLSQFMVLRPGDLINTGTPAGVALGLPDHPYLRPGNVVTLEIDHLGRAEQKLEQA